MKKSASSPTHIADFVNHRCRRATAPDDKQQRVPRRQGAPMAVLKNAWAFPVCDETTCGHLIVDATLVEALASWVIRR
jgi:hypothetical protein